MENNKKSANNWILILLLSIFIILITLVLLYFYDKYKPSSIYKCEREDKPIVKIENFSDSLKKLGKLAEEQKDKSFAIYVTPIVNRTARPGKVPPDISLIINSALMGISNKKVIVVSDANQVISNNDFYGISGAITALNQTKKSIYIKLNLNPWNVATKVYISGMNTEVSMSFYETKNGNKGFTIKSQAYNISGNTLENYDIHSMITIISRLAVIELIGKLRNYPYWNCIKGAKVNFELLNKKVDLELSGVNEQRISIPK